MLCALVAQGIYASPFDKIGDKWRKFEHRFGGKRKNHPNHGWKNQKNHVPKTKGVKAFEDQFQKKRDLLRQILESHKRGHHPLFPRHPMCHHMPKMPFNHRPVYPFNPRPLYPALPRPMNHYPMRPLNPVPPGFTQVHFFGQYQSVKQGNMLLGNGKMVHVTEIKSISVEIDFRIDNQLLTRMRNQFAKYHRKWIWVLGGILGGYEAVLPFVKKTCKRKKFHGFNKFPKIMNRLVRLHQMIARHEALLRMLHDAQVNKEKIALLEKKLSLAESKFKMLEEKLDRLENLNQKRDKDIGKEKE